MTANKFKPQRGTVLVEAAFTLLLLFIFLFGLVEVGRFISVQQVLTNAAREGARLRVAPLSQTTFLASEDEVHDAVCTYLNAASVRCDQATITTNNPEPSTTECPPSGVLSCTRVHVEMPYQPVTLSMFGHFSVTLKAEALMRNETSP